MASRGGLSGLQKMMLRWEEFHPVNAAHVVRLGWPESVGVVERVVRETCQALGLGPVGFCARRQRFEYPDAPAVPVPFEQRSTAAGVAKVALEELLDEQLNLPFPPGCHWPLRFVLLDGKRFAGKPGAPAQHEQHLVLVYQHAISDSRGMSILLREVLRGLARGSVESRPLQLDPPALEKLFPADLGWLRWPSLVLASIREVFHSKDCLTPPQRFSSCPWKKSSMNFFHSVARWKSRGFPRSTGSASSDAALDPQPASEHWVTSAIQCTDLSTARLKKSAQQCGGTVGDLLFAAVLEALHFHFWEEQERAGRHSLAVYAPVDLRQEAPVDVGHALGQILGCMMVRARLDRPLLFGRLCAQVTAQTRRAKQTRSYRAHAAHMDLMARCWDLLPRSINRWLGPGSCPLAAFISNVNLTGFLDQEMAAGQVLEYHRVTGTGLMVPMMFGITTLGPSVSVTTTHRSTVFDPADMARISAHVLRRLKGELPDAASREEFAAFSIPAGGHWRKPSLAGCR